MNSTDYQAVSAKIKDILSDGKNTVSESCAANTLRNARRVLDNYQYIPLVDEDTLGQADFSSKSRVQKSWVSTIAISIAELNDCIVCNEGGIRSNLRYCFKGHQKDAELSVVMMAYLIDACDNMYQDSKGMLGLSGIADKNKFYKVMAEGLSQRISEKLDSRNGFLCADIARGNLNNKRRVAVSKTYGRTNFKKTSQVNSKYRNLALLTPLRYQ